MRRHILEEDDIDVEGLKGSIERYRFLEQEVAKRERQLAEIGEPDGLGLVVFDEAFTFHCLHGCPTGASAINDVIVREIYTLSSNDFTKQADWVAYRVTPDTIGSSGARAWTTGGSRRRSRPGTRRLEAR